MSVVVWDGKTLAADRQVTVCGLGRRGSKITQLEDGTVLAFTGGLENGLAVARWYKEGADPKRWPTSQTDKEFWSRLIVASRDCLFVYEMLPEPQPVCDEYA